MTGKRSYIEQTTEMDGRRPNQEVAQGIDEAGEFEDFDVGGQLGNVVPADDYVQPVTDAVVAEIAALNSNSMFTRAALGAIWRFRLAIGEAA